MSFQKAFSQPIKSPEWFSVMNAGFCASTRLWSPMFRILSSSFLAVIFAAVAKRISLQPFWNARRALTDLLWMMYVHVLFLLVSYAVEREWGETPFSRICPLPPTLFIVCVFSSLGFFFFYSFWTWAKNNQRRRASLSPVFLFLPICCVSFPLLAKGWWRVETVDTFYSRAMPWNDRAMHFIIIDDAAPLCCCTSGDHRRQLRSVVASQHYGDPGALSGGYGTSEGKETQRYSVHRSSWWYSWRE